MFKVCYEMILCISIPFDKNFETVDKIILKAVKVLRALKHHVIRKLMYNITKYLKAFIVSIKYSQIKD